MVLGTVAGQAIVILSAPILSRIYGPEEFGVLAVYAALLSVTASIATMRYEVSIPLPRSDGSATVMLVIASLIVIAMSVLCASALWAGGRALVNWTNTPALAPYLWCVPLGVFLSGIHGVFTYWGLRKKAFGLIAQTRFQQGVSMAGSQVLLGYLNWGPIGLITGHILGFTAGLVSLTIHWWRTGAASLRSVSKRRMLIRGARYKDYPLYSSWGGVVNTAGLQLPVILFAAFYSPAVAGLYLLANRVASAPVGLVAEAVGKVFYVSAVDARRRGTLAKLVLSVFEILCTACFVPFAVIGIVAPEFFAIIFSAVWTEAGVYLQWLVLWMATVFVFAPLAMLYSVLYRHREDLYFQLALVAARIGGIAFGAFLGGPVTAVAVFSLAGASVYIVFGVRLLRAAEVDQRRLAAVAGRESMFALGAGVLLWVTKMVFLKAAPSLRDIPTGILIALAGALIVATAYRVRKAYARMNEIGAKSQTGSLT